MASGNMKIGIITECIQQLIIKLLNVLCLGPCLLLSTMHSFTFKLLLCQLGAFSHSIARKGSINTAGAGYIYLIAKQYNFCFPFVQDWEFKNECKQFAQVAVGGKKVCQLYSQCIKRFVLQAFFFFFFLDDFYIIFWQRQQEKFGASLLEHYCNIPRLGL